MERERMLFFVDPRVDEELKHVVESVAREAAIIFDAEVEYAGTSPDNYSSRRFTLAGKVLGDKGFGPQRDADLMLGEIVKLLGYERKVIFITFDDITVHLSWQNYLNFCFGATRGYDVVISMRRFMHLSIKEQKLILAGLIMHEIGHIYDLAACGSRANTEDRLGSHCTSSNCVMRQGVDIDEMRKNFLFLNANRRLSVRDAARKYYCQLCAKYIEGYFARKRASASRPITTPPALPKRAAR